MTERRSARAQPQNLQQLAGRAVSRDDALTKTVGKERSFRAIVRRKTGHDRRDAVQRRTNTPILKNGRKSLSDLHSRALAALSTAYCRLQACRHFAKTVTGC